MAMDIREKIVELLAEFYGVDPMYQGLDIREKIVELLAEFYGVDPMYHGLDANALAQHLVAHGVTVLEDDNGKEKQ